MNRHIQLGESAYRAHPFTSNSDFSKLHSRYLPMDALRFGTLFHSVTLEPKTVDYIQGTVKGYDYQYTQDEIRHTMRMNAAVRRDSFVASLLNSSSVEVEMYNLNTDFAGTIIDTKRKYDFWNYVVGWGGDLKSTSATTEQQFLEDVDQYDYDRARVFYAKGSGARRDFIVGVSKVYPHKIFKVFMQQGCPLWKRGIEKGNALAIEFRERNPLF